jgi:hypothetical protein
MNNSDERDYAEEEYNRRTMEEEFRAEKRAETHEMANSVSSMYFTQSGPFMTFVWEVVEASDPRVIHHTTEMRDGSRAIVHFSAYNTRDRALDAIRSGMELWNELEESYYLVDLDKI